MSVRGRASLLARQQLDAYSLARSGPIQVTLPGNSGGSRAVDAPSPLEDQTGISSSLTVSPSTVVGGSESVVTVTLESAVSTDTVVGLAG